MFVSPDMELASFWLALLNEPDKIILTCDEITAFNSSVRTALPNTVFDLSSYPSNLSGDRLKELLTKPFPQDTKYVAGIPLTPSYFEQLAHQVAAEDVREENPVSYGFTVCRTAVRTFPTTDFVVNKPDDYEFDRFQETTLDPAEGVLILHYSADKSWYFVQAYNYRGWIQASNVAVTDDRNEWTNYLLAPQCLTVTDNKLVLSHNPFSPELSGLIFAMGARLVLASADTVPAIIDRQASAGNYVIKLPVRDEAGSLVFKYALVPKNDKVVLGSLAYTRSNIIKQVFKLQGGRYGWGGLFGSHDCSAVVLDLYRSFGLRLPRNASEQAIASGSRLEIAGDKAGRMQLLDKLKPGGTLHMPGHVMVYLGKYKDNHCCIHAIAAHGLKEADGSIRSVPINGIVVTDLHLLRITGETLLEALTVARQIE